jgi:hypothetical protein
MLGSLGYALYYRLQFKQVPWGCVKVHVDS